MQSKFNRAWQAKRQMGSVFKPIIYAAAVAQGASVLLIQKLMNQLPLSSIMHYGNRNNYNHRFDRADDACACIGPFK